MNYFNSQLDKFIDERIINSELKNDMIDIDIFIREFTVFYNNYHVPKNRVINYLKIEHAFSFTKDNKYIKYCRLCPYSKI